jgi:hypothetical protein
MDHCTFHESPRAPRGPFDAAGHSTQPQGDRRDFLKSLGTISVGLAMAHIGAEPAAAGEQPKVPQVAFGKVQLSRVICGSNPFNAGSHLSSFVNQEMRSYYTPEQILKTLRRCEQADINCWQTSGLANMDLYRQLVDEGSRMHAISLGRDPADFPALAKGGCLAVAHHGEVTDNLFKAGKLDEVHDFLKRVRDNGMLAGVSTHMPAVVDAIESKGWEPDYYMTCVYERNRSNEELKKLLGYVPIPPREVYLEEDPPRMFQAMRNAPRPCLAFKILAAGRLCDRKETVERAFRETFQGIKPSDAVIVGIYDRYSDQPGEDAGFAQRYGNGKVT